jgi:hypothetical protein
MRLDFYLGLIYIFSATFSYSQIIEPSSGIEKHILQIETEAQYAVYNEGMEKDITWSLPSFLFRYGLFKDFELQLNVPLVIEQLYESDHLVNSSNRFGNIQIGASINLWKQNDLIPQAAFMVRVILPVKNDEEFNVDGKILAFNFSNAIIDKWTLNSNIGYVHQTDNSNTGYYIVNLNYDLSQKSHFFIENFSDFSNKFVFSQNINVGGGYTIKKNMCLDFSVANGINHDFFYTSLRLTWVINTKK